MDSTAFEYPEDDPHISREQLILELRDLRQTYLNIERVNNTLMIEKNRLQSLLNDLEHTQFKDIIDLSSHPPSNLPRINIPVNDDDIMDEVIKHSKIKVMRKIIYSHYLNIVKDNPKEINTNSKFLQIVNEYRIDANHNNSRILNKEG